MEVDKTTDPMPVEEAVTEEVIATETSDQRKELEEELKFLSKKALRRSGLARASATETELARIEELRTLLGWKKEEKEPASEPASPIEKGPHYFAEYRKGARNYRILRIGDRFLVKKMPPLSSYGHDPAVARQAADDEVARLEKLKREIPGRA